MLIIAVFAVFDPYKHHFLHFLPYLSTLELYGGLQLADLSWYESDLTIDVYFAALEATAALKWLKIEQKWGF